MQQLNLEIMEFVERQILPRYAAFGKSHGISHVQNVIANSIALAKLMGVDVNMAYVIAAYHDIGMSGPRAIHHITSGKILLSDARLKRWFSPEQLKVMKEAVEDHRASASRQPRSIYGKIVAEADRELDADTVFRRTILFGLEKYPELSAAEHWDRFRQHLADKYSRNGYIRLWIPNSPNREKLNTLQTLIEDDEKLRQYFDRIFAEETQRA